jgi:hypothetical protein
MRSIHIQLQNTDDDQPWVRMIACNALQIAPLATGLEVSKSTLDGFLYLGFFITFLLAIGSNYLSILSEALGARVDLSDYDDCGRVYAKGTVDYSALAIIFFVAAIASTSPQPTAVSLIFYFAVFGVPLTITLAILLGQLLFATTYYRSWERWRQEKRFHLFLGTVAALLGTGAFVVFNLVNSYMVAPEVPEALSVVVQTQGLQWGDLLFLMVNKTWLPLTIKLLLVAVTTSALLFSAVAALSMRKNRTREALFRTRWAFKLALLFGTPVGIVGYWVAAEFHVATPTIALGLMGQETQTGVAAALLSSVNPLWHLGIVGVVAIAALAATFYYGQASTNNRPGWSRRIVTQELTKIAAVLCLVGLASTIASALLYQQQAIWTIYLLILGYLLIQSLWFYSTGRLNVKMPMMLFAAACLGLLLLIGPYNSWYLAEKYGGVPWPPVAFVAFVPVGYLLGRQRSLGYYMIPLISGLFLPVALFAKMVDTALIRGATIIAIDPTIEPIINYWSQSQGVNIQPAYHQYPTTTTLDLVLIIVLAYLFFMGITYLAIRANRQEPSTTKRGL